AHLEALFERYAPERVSLTESLGGRPATGSYRVVVEAGLSRIEIEARTSRMASVLVPLDAFLVDAQGALRDAESVQNLLLQEGLSRRSGSGTLELVVSAEGAKALRRVGERVEALLPLLFSHSAGSFYSVAIERERNPDNTELLDHIRVLAR